MINKDIFKKAIMWFGAHFKINRKKQEEIICSRCKKSILKDNAFIIVRGDIVMYNPNIKPTLFTCPEHAFNYAQRLVMHSTCWIETLKDHGAELFDMQKVAEEYKKKNKIKDLNLEGGSYGLGQD
ncbi:MAG: hypothetical protein HZA72_01245 [Candidatus Omnitrophica bacterium]|nr:hypothetical protein [Candidatus Omnitrophota bacterium]